MKINKKNFTLPELTFNNICELEKKGTPLSSINDNYMCFLRGYISIAMNCTVEKAGEEIEEFLKSGGSLKELINEMNEQVKESGFFHSSMKPKK